MINSDTRDQSELINNIKVIRLELRTHRDQIGDYRCWVDDEKLYYGLLPELQGRAASVPSPDQFAAFCTAFHNNRQNPHEARCNVSTDSSKAPLHLQYSPDLDSDLNQKSLQELRDELNKLIAGIRDHQLKTHLQRTHVDDASLYKLLPECVEAVTQLPPREAFLENCARYNQHCQRSPKDFRNSEWNPE